MTRRLLPAALLVAAALAPASAQAAAKDADRDGLPDRWETAHKVTSPTSDRDKDGLNAWGEWRSGTDPRKKDTDRDGRRDGREDADHDDLPNAWEVDTGNDPGDADSDDDGRGDGEERAGRVLKLQGSRITIGLPGGKKLRATLDRDLALTCAASRALDEQDLDESAEDAEPAAGDEPAEVEASSVVEDVLDDVADALGGDDGADPLADDPDAEDEPAEDVCAPALKRGAYVTEAVVRLTRKGAVVEALDLA